MEGQMSIFDFINCDTKPDRYSINKPIRLIELFSGIGAQSKALERLGANFEHYKTSEWEIHSCASYHRMFMKEDTTDYSSSFSDEEIVDKLIALGISSDGKTPLSRKEIERKNEQWHREVYNDFIATNNLGSIMNFHGEDLKIVDKDKYAYLLFYSFPCQDLSIAGKQKGMSKDDNTRSGLLWEVERLLYECKEINALPDVCILENVTQVHGKKFIDDFNSWCKSLEDLGYTNFWADLNAKDFGVPQSRNRTFMISILSQNVTFEFPKPINLKYTMEDCLENKVDEKYYINNEKSQKLIQEIIAKENLKKKEELTFHSKTQDSLQLQMPLSQGMTKESRIEPTKVAVLLRNQGSEIIRETEIASTLKARDWKGFENYCSNGVIEVNE